MGYRFLRFPGGKAKAVTLSYDDGCTADIKLAEVLDKYGIKCTFNLNSTRVLAGKDLTVEDANRLMANGHEVAVHGKNHMACGIVSPAEGVRDVLTCREELEKAFGRIIRGMAYPDTGITHFANGADYAKVKNYLTDLGIVYSRTLGGDNDSFTLPTDWHAWMPTAHHSNPEIMTFIDKFLALDNQTCYCAMRHPRLFYMWGHAYEFDCNDNWDLLDKICEKLAGHDDIWYATNIGIYDYVAAYNSLLWSADHSIVYNPTLYDIYFNITDHDYCVKSGETLYIQ